MKRVLIGLAEIAGNIRDLGLAFTQEGYHAETVITSKNVFYQQFSYTHTLEPARWLRSIRFVRSATLKLRQWCFFLFNFWKFDYIVYVWRDTFLPFRLDQLLLKLLRRKFCIIFCGDDIRFRPIALACEEKKFGIRNFDGAARNAYLAGSDFRDFRRKLFLTLFTNFLTRNIFSARSQSTLTLKPFYKLFMPLFIPPNQEVKKRDRPTIIHAPSNRVAKNTDFIVAAVEELKNEGHDFDFLLLQQQTNEKVLSTLAEGHIAVDQFSSLPGRFAQEAMYCHCAVMGGNKQVYERKCPDIPVVDIVLDKADFKNKMRDLIRHPDKIVELGAKGRRYIETYHSGAMSVTALITAMDGEREPDQIPIFESKQELLSFCEDWKQRLLIKMLVF